MQSYLLIYLGLSVSAITLMGFINWLVDPLWYGKGNQLTSRNFAFNERVSKTNLFLQTKESKSYDCIIFGSSTATLLRSSYFEDQTCFNYAFNAGRVEEFIEYARYLKDQGVEPSVVYVGVDPFNFSFLLSEFSGPVVIDPKPIYQAYLSSDSFLFSLRTIFQESPYPRYYDSSREFESDVIENPPQYQPEFTSPEPLGGCYGEKVDLYRQLREVFPDAKFVGYVPPYSGWYVVNEIYAPEWLGCYLEAVHGVSETFDELYDFSIPSPVTTRTDNTYDGSHYFPEVHKEVAQVLQDQTGSFGFDVKGHSLEVYEETYEGAVEDFLEREGQR